MNVSHNVDIQVESVSFVIERKADAKWRANQRSGALYFVLAYNQCGSANYRIGENAVSIKKGNVLLMKKDQVYAGRVDEEDPWTFYAVGFSLTVADEETQRVIDELPNVFRSSDSSRMAANFAELYRVWSTKGAGYLVKCRSLILDIIYILLSDEFRRSKVSAHYGKIDKIVNMIRANCEKTYSIDELAEISGLSSSHFRMLFKEMTGVSVVQFHNRLRMDRAKDLLISGSCNVTEAASAVGFDNVYYFSRLFRKLTGKNPSEYLKL